jgi:hypothetical protein
MKKSRSALPFLFLVPCSSFPLAACTASAPSAPSSWHVVLSNQQGTLLCVWGTAPNDVFTVGGALGNGSPTVMLHYDGSAWHDLAPGGTETFWWTHGTSDHDVWAVGENGRIVHWDGAAFTTHASGTTATLFGVWAAAANDAWAVGGTPEGGMGKPNDVVLHFDGTSWTPSPLPMVLGRTYFKVWGSSADDVFVVGEAGTVWHRAGGQWTQTPSGATGTLLTVNGCSANEVYAVGARDVLRWGGTSWSRDAQVQLLQDVNGVSCGPPGSAVIVGCGGLKQRWVGGAWHEDFMDDPLVGLQGAWADGTGAFWAAGGDFGTPPAPGVSRGGTLAYFGPTAPRGN